MVRVRGWASADVFSAWTRGETGIPATGEVRLDVESGVALVTRYVPARGNNLTGAMTQYRIDVFDEGDGRLAIGPPVVRPADRRAALPTVFGMDPAALRPAAACPRRGGTGQRPLADLRSHAGPTQQELAHHLGVTVRALSHGEVVTRPVPCRVVRQPVQRLRRPVAQVLAAAGLGSLPISRPEGWRATDLPGLLATLRRSAGWSAAEPGRRLGVTGGRGDAEEAGPSRPMLPACGRMQLDHDPRSGALSRLVPARHTGDRSPSAVGDRRLGHGRPAVRACFDAVPRVG